MSKIQGLILCGGKSTRMGTDKTKALLKGKPLLSYSVELFKSLNMDFHLSINSSQTELYQTHQCVIDQHEEKGPLGGITSSLKALNKSLLVVPVDMPKLNAELIKELMSNSDQSKLVECFQVDERIEPFPSIWKVESLVQLEGFLNEGMLSLQQCIKHLPHQLIKTNGNSQFQNLNYPSELR